MLRSLRLGWAVVPLLAAAGCGPQGAADVPSAPVSASAFASVLEPIGNPASAKAVVYVAQGNKVRILSQNEEHQVLGTIRDGVSEPRALWDDNAGNLYVANSTGSVTIYPLGSVHPALTLTSGLVNPLSVAVDNAGTVYVGDNDGQIVEYAAGQTSPSLVIPPQYAPGFSQYLFPREETIGPDGNLYVNYVVGASWNFVAEIAAGTSNVQFLGIKEPTFGGIIFDKDGLLLVGVQDESNPAGIYVYQLDPLKQVRIFGDRGYPWAFAFNASGDRLYDAHSPQLWIYLYPEGRRVRTLNLGEMWGVALYPHLPY